MVQKAPGDPLGKTLLAVTSEAGKLPYQLPSVSKTPRLGQSPSMWV